MKRLTVYLITVALVLSGCTSDTSFNEEGGVCYRTRSNHFIGIPTGTSRVQSVDKNCGDG